MICKQFTSTVSKVHLVLAINISPANPVEPVALSDTNKNKQCG